MTPNDASGRTRPHHTLSAARFRLPLAGLLAVAFLLAAGPAAAQDATAEPTETPVPTPAPDAPRIVLEFSELNDSGIEGTATLSQAGDQTIVELDLEGAGENHPAHIHEGVCDEIVPQSAYDLENVGGEGASRSLVDAPLQTLIDGDYVVDLHLAPNELGTLIACADIEGTPEAPGVGGPTATPGAATAESTAGPTEAATEAPTQEPTAEPTTEPTAEPTEAPSPTPEPTEEPSPTPAPTQAPTEEPTEAPGDGTGGIQDAVTPVTTPVGDGTDGGKGIPLAETSQDVGVGSGKGVPVGGAASDDGDGTQGGGADDSGKGATLDPTTSLPVNAGSGSSLPSPQGPLVAMWASAAFATVLVASGWLVRRGELRAAGSRRWRRRGL